MPPVTGDTPILEISGLHVDLHTRSGPLKVLDDIALTVSPGEILGVVGESGAGKSVLGASIIGLQPAAMRIAAGTIAFNGRRIDTLEAEAMRTLRGREIGTIFQDPMTSLNPLLTVGDQLVETIRTHTALSAREAAARAAALLADVGIPDPAQRMAHYPHQFSGGMRQRVVIALALCINPKLVIADEPTTALDVSVQAQILGVLERLCRDHGAAVILITHDMGVIAEMADRVAVLYAGRMAEIGSVHDVLSAPLHPYTQGLMGSIVQLGARPRRLAQISGAMPRLGEVRPDGCPFVDRCPSALGLCASHRPSSVISGRSVVACWHHDAGGARRAHHG